MKIAIALPLVTCVAAAYSNPPIGPRTCIVKASGSNSTDDAPAIRSAFNECGRHGKIVFEPTTYFVNSVLNISGLEDVDIDVQGQLLVCVLTYVFCTATNRIYSGAPTYNTGSMRLFQSDTKTNPQLSS